MEPKIAQKSPFEADLSEGVSVFWCACGQSANQPFCDGSHQGSEFTPVEYVPERSGAHFLCGCKRTGNKPLCDGTHNGL
ncbi:MULTISPECIES: CDGSH iron-sulfur domain-containing protein [unclassified Saccharicrinis]|uniref:CDGSH iron-sulfur domain-containing protein n=1 Tax=unclassified Saccharicrinis TaxID=2646859 RepID=UPI003D33C2C8